MRFLGAAVAIGTIFFGYSACANPKLLSIRARNTNAISFFLAFFSNNTFCPSFVLPPLRHPAIRKHNRG